MSFERSLEIERRLGRVLILIGTDKHTGTENGQPFL